MWMHLWRSIVCLRVCVFAVVFVLLRSFCPNYCVCAEIAFVTVISHASHVGHYLHSLEICNNETVATCLFIARTQYYGPTSICGRLTRLMKHFVVCDPDFLLPPFLAVVKNTTYCGGNWNVFLQFPPSSSAAAVATTHGMRQQKKKRQGEDVRFTLVSDKNCHKKIQSRT